MREIVHREFDEPSGVRGVEEVPLPEAGPAEVRTRMTTSPIHDHDHDHGRSAGPTLLRT